MLSRSLHPFSRREVLSRVWNGIGALALSHMLAQETEAAIVNPLAAKP